MPGLFDDIVDSPPNPLDDAIAQASATEGVPADYLRRLAEVESGYGQNLRNPSGAAGPFQFMPGTALQYGLDNPDDPYKSASAAARLTRDNQESLRRSLGREPTAGELYLAHQQGGLGATRLLKNADQPAVSVVPPQHIRANGGREDMSAGDFARMWTDKFGDIQVHPAGGATSTQGLFDDIVGGSQEAAPKGDLFEDIVPTTQAQPQVPTAQQPTVAVPQGQEKPWYEQRLFGAEPAPGEETALWGGAARGVGEAVKNLGTLGAVTGAMSPSTAAQLQREGEDIQKAFPETTSYIKAQEEEQRILSNGGGTADWLRLAWDNPKYIATKLAESTGQSATAAVGGAATGFAGGAAAGPVGMAVGTVAGTGLASFVQEYAANIQQELEQRGFDLKDEKQWENALANKEMMAEIERKYAARAGIVGGTDALTALIGVKGGGRVLVNAAEQLVRNTAKQAAIQTADGTLKAGLKEGAANLVIEMGGAMAGETAAQAFVDGRISVPDIIMEGLGEATVGVPSAAMETITAHNLREGSRPPTDEEIRAAYGLLPSEPIPKTFEEAQGEGRTWYGFVPQSLQEGEVATVSTDYAAAESKMGTYDPRKGTLVAAGPDEITAPLDEAKVVAQTNDGGSVKLVMGDVVPPSWEAFIAAPTKDNYAQAIADGVRIRPRGTTAIFVGDTKASQILPKEEAVIAKDLVFVKGRGIKGALNLGTLTQDSRFSIAPTQAGVERFMDSDNVETIGPRIVAVNDPHFQQTVDTRGYAGLFHELALMKQPQLDEVFKSKRLTVIPSSLWNASSRGHSVPNLNVTTELSDEETLNALRAGHLATGATKIGAFATPYVFGKRMGWTPKFQMPNQGGFIAIDPSVSEEHRRVADTGLRVASKLLSGAGVKRRVHVVMPGTNERFGVGIMAEDQFAEITAEVVAQKSYGSMSNLDNGDAVIVLGSFMSPVEMYGTLMHEMGHALSYFKFAELSDRMQNQIFGAYRRFLLATDHSRFSRAETFLRRRAAAMNVRGAGVPMAETALRYDADYYLSFEEWFAEQVARWALTSRAPLGDVAHFFRALAKQVLTVLRRMREAFTGEAFRPEVEMDSWLDGMYNKGERSTWGTVARGALDQRTREANLKHDSRAPMTPEDAGIHKIVDVYYSRPPGGLTPPPAGSAPAGGSPAQLKAHISHMNWMGKWALGIKQMMSSNPDQVHLQRYGEFVEMMQLTANNIMTMADDFLRGPARKVRKQGKNKDFANFLYDMTNMVYRRPNETQPRWPTRQEFQALVAKHKLNSDALAAWNELAGQMQDVVGRIKELQLEEANRTLAGNPLEYMAAVARINAAAQKMQAAPYFPMTRFGRYAVTVRNHQGHVEHFELFEKARDQKAAYNAALKQYPQSMGYGVTSSTMPDNAMPYTGVPSWLLDKLMELPHITPDQKEWMNLLRFELSPEKSFQKHLLRRNRTPGYSMDWERVYAQYMFHHARHYARVKFYKQMDAEITAQRNQNKLPGERSKETDLANFMQDHFSETLNPSLDFALLRTATALWHLGFSPAAAGINATQMIVMTYPYLGSKFGDIKAMRAMIDATRDISTYYKRGSYAGQTDFEMRALDYLIKQGAITESQAAELAAVSQGQYASKFMSNIANGLQRFTNGAMLMFKLVEQMNRRVTARATLKLAMADPTNPHLDAVAKRYFLHYNALTSGNNPMTDLQAKATLAARLALDETQYDYSKVNRPRFMRGKLNNLFAFYMFTQNTIYQVFLNPQNRGLMIRYMLIMAGLAGLRGLIPDELKDVLNAVGKMTFGDFDLEREMYKFVNYIGGSPDSADLILHGIAREGWGIPQLMDMAGIGWWPKFDRSQAVSLRRVLPLPVTDFLVPGNDFNKTVSNIVKNGAGASFGPFFALYQSLMNEPGLEWSDPKRWEAAMPRAARSIFRAARLGVQGGERQFNYAKTLGYDVSDPEQLLELAGIAMGYQPTRQAQYYDMTTAQHDYEDYWNNTRRLLMLSAYREKVFYNSDEGFKEVIDEIQAFNKRAPEKRFIITKDSLKRSMKGRSEAGAQGPKLGLEIQQIYPGAKTIEQRQVK